MTKTRVAPFYLGHGVQMVYYRIQKTLSCYCACALVCVTADHRSAELQHQM